MMSVSRTLVDGLGCADSEDWDQACCLGCPPSATLCALLVLDPHAPMYHLVLCGRPRLQSGPHCSLRMLCAAVPWLHI